MRATAPTPTRSAADGPVAGGVRDGRYADFYDFGVTTIDFLVRRDPDPHWSTPRPDYADDRSHVLAVGLEGAADYRISADRIVVGAGDVLLFPRGCPHGGRSVAARPFGFVSIGFDATGPDGDVGDQLEGLPRWFPGPHDRAMATVQELHAAWLLRRPGYLIQCRALLMELLHGLIREQTQSHHYSVHDRKIVSIIARLRASAERTVVVADLAAELGLSESHFRHLFKNFTGLSVKSTTTGSGSPGRRSCCSAVSAT